MIEIKPRPVHVVRNRIPVRFFRTSGVGESDVTIHAGSYHLALRAARIEQANQIGYSSILPAQAVEVPHPSDPKLRDDGLPTIVHGEVMESISAVAHARYGETATAGLIFGWLHDRDTDERYGGLVCEYSGSMVAERVPGHLREMLSELHRNGYEHLTLKDSETMIETITPMKMFGTALVALCFIAYEIEEIEL